jgi:formate dehydrogenase alpha subunit
VGAQGQAIPFKEKLLIGSMAVKERGRCILCGRCVRMCEEVQGVKEIDFIGRGFMTKIGTDFDRDLNCEFCGQCVSTCPVGALTTTLIKHKARHWELKKVKSVCAYCGCGCALLLGVKDDQLRTVISEYDTGANEGNMCVKGRYGWEYIHSEERLSTPLIRKEGKLVESTWDEALQEIAAQFKRIKKDHGPDALAAIGSARLTNEEGYLLQKFMRAAIGTNNVDNSGRFSYEGLLALKDSLGYPAMTNSIEEIGNADVILALRSDLRETHPLVKIEVIKALSRNKAQLITANSIGTWFDDKAKISLLYRPGTEVALLNGIIRIILEEGLEDKEFISTRTVGFEALRDSVARYDPATVEQITGVTSDLITRAARMYAQGDRAAILIASGLSSRSDEAGLARAAANLALLTGNIGRESTGVSIMGEKNNSQGVLDMGVMPDYLPGFQEVADEDARKKCALTWMVQLSAEPGQDGLTILKSAGNKKVKALYIVGENPVTTYPDRNQTMQALEQVDFLVVQDLFLSETAKQAHVVLPVVSFSEKEGTFTSIERRVQRFYRTLDPQGLARSDLDIIQALSNSLGYPMNYASPEQVMEEIKQLVPLYAGITYGRLGEKGLQWPCVSAGDSGSKYLYEDGFPAGNAEFKPVEDCLSEAKSSSEFPFILVPVQSLCHSGSFSLWSQTLGELSQDRSAELNAEDAKRLQVESGTMITISSSKGAITVPSKITERTPPGKVILSYHFDQLKVNILTDSDNPLTPVSIKKA